MENSWGRRCESEENLWKVSSFYSIISMGTEILTKFARILMNILHWSNTHQQQPKQVYDFSFANTTPVYTAADGRVHVFCAPMQPLPRNSISLFANVRVHWVFPHFLCTIVMTCFPWKLDIRLARVGLHFFFSLCLYYVLLFRFVRSFFLLIYNVQQSAPGIFSRSSEFHAVTVNSALLSFTFSMPYCRTTVCKNRWM